MTFPFTVLLAALLPSAYVREIPDEARRTPLVSIAEARARLIANHGERVFFRTTGTVVASKDGTPAHFILLDDTSASDVLCSCDDRWQVGDEIAVLCTAMQHRYENPTLLSEALEITVLRHGTPAEPRFIHPVDLTGHRNDFSVVTLAGTVTDAFPDDLNPEWTILILVQDDVQAMVWTHTENIRHALRNLVDAELRITGVVLPGLSNFYRARGPWILATSADAISVTRPQPEDPFDSSARPPHRQTKTGRVVACWRNNAFVLATDNDQRIRVRLAEGGELPSPGNRVTVAGFLRHNEFCTRLANALFRIDSSGTEPPETPTDVRAEDILFNATGKRQVDPKLNGRTIRIAGTVRECHAAGTDEATLVLASDRANFSIWTGAARPMPAVGSRVEVTGACLIEDSADMGNGVIRATGFSVALRSPNDLLVLATPPWWTPARLLTVMAVLALGFLAILVWNAALRKIVIRRSRALARETIRSSNANLRLRERTRLAVELHDTIAQNLTGASFEIKTIARLADTAPRKMREHLAIVDRTLKSCRDDIRNCIWDLRANSLEQKDLNDAIRMALDPHTGSAALQIRFNVPRTHIPEPTLHALMRIVRELAINAVRHGGATEIKVAGSIEGDELVFSVRDNGCGFVPEKAPGAAQGHFGLQGIRERIRPLDGSLTVFSAPGAGTRAVVRLNLHAGDGKTKP